MDIDKKQPFENPTVDEQSDLPAHEEDRAIGHDTEREITQLINGIES